MKYLKPLNESWEPTVPQAAALERIQQLCFDILVEELGKESAMGSEQHVLERAEMVMLQQLEKEKSSYAAIVSNCKQRGFREKYMAESVYQEIIKGRIEALLERDWINGGLKK